MQAGLLTELITFTAAETVRDDFGGTSEKWVKRFEKRARVQFKSGNRGEVNGEVINSSVVTISIRYCKDITEKMRIEYDGRKYRINSINRDRHQQSTVIEASLINE